MPVTTGQMRNNAICIPYRVAGGGMNWPDKVVWMSLFDISNTLPKKEDKRAAMGDKRPMISKSKMRGEIK